MPSIEQIKTLLSQATTNDLLPPGSRVCLVLGGGSQRPTGQRIVAGEVVGYSISADRASVRLALRSLSTWLYHGGAPSVESLPADFSSVFLITVRGRVEETLRVLKESSREGRSSVPARELAYERCPRNACGCALSSDWVYCSDCGDRVAMGGRIDRPRGHPASWEKIPYCSGCWHQHPPAGGYCPFCGYDRGFRDRLQQVVGQTRDLVLTVGRDRVGRFRGTISRADYRKVHRSRGSEILLSLTRVEWLGGRPVPPVASNFVATVSLNLWDGSPTSTLERLLAGGEIRASESLRRCSQCVTSLGWKSWRPGDPRPANTPRTVWGAYCTHCGARGRLLPSDQWLNVRPGNRMDTRDPTLPQVHQCGSIYLPSHAFCGRCGVGLMGSPDRDLERWRYEAFVDGDAALPDRIVSPESFSLEDFTSDRLV